MAAANEGAAAVEVKAGLKDRLAAMKAKRMEAREANQVQVVEEDRVSKLPANYERRRAQADWELQDSEKRKAAEAAGKDYQRVKAMHMTVEQAERHVKKRTPKEMDATVDRTTHEYAGYQQYLQQVKKVKANRNAYERSVEGADCSADSLQVGQHRPRPAAIDHMVSDLEKAIAKKQARKKKGRLSRVALVESDIDFINDKNKEYNRQLERHYGDYSRDIKDSLERGTAV